MGKNVWLVAVALLALGCGDLEQPPVGFGLAGKGDASSIAEYTPVFSARVVTDRTPARFEGGYVGELLPGTRLVILRSYMTDGSRMYLFVSADALRIGVTDILLQDNSRPAVAGELDDTSYVEQLARYRSRALSFLGYAHGKRRFALTIDMCQSVRKWERELFDWIVEYGLAHGKPAPVGVAMTGRWAVLQADSFEQLLRWRRERLIDIVWINHSYHHQLSQVGDRYLFLTHPKIDFVQEVLELERLLLDRGEVPSLLFRFPGLTHDAHRLAQLNDLGLFALDADAWLAKGQPLSDNSVVLLHGNGNEPAGVRRFFKQVAPDTVLGRQIISGDVVLADPRDVLSR